MASGIYHITHTGSGKMYVGSASNIRHRVSQHFWQLKTGRHHNAKLQNAFNKYGRAAFGWGVLEEVADASRLVAREQHYFDALKPHFNICPVAGRTVGVTRTAAARRRIGAANAGERNGMYGRKHSPEAMAAIAAASRQRAGSSATVAALSKGHGWNRGQSWPPESRRKMSDAKPKIRVERVCPLTGETKTYESIKAAAKDGFHASHVSDCCKGRSVVHKGYWWRYAS